MNKIVRADSIKLKFIFAGFLICAISLAIISLTSYTISYKITEKETNEKISEAALKFASELNTFFIENGAVLHSIVVNRETYNYNDQFLKQYVSGIYKREMQRKSAIIDVYVGFSDKRMVTGSGWVPPPDYDCTTRPWYKLAIEKDALVYTVPYLDARTKEMIITIAEPIKQNGSVIAVAAADIFVTELKNIAEKVRIGEKSYTFLLDNEQNILVHPNKDFLPIEKGLRNLSNVLDGKYKPLAQKINDGIDNKIEINDYDNTKKIVIFSKIGLPNWIFGIVISKSEYRKPLQKLLYGFLFAFIISLVAGIGIMFYLINGLVKPIEHLRIAMKRFSEKDFTSRSTIHSRDEIGELSSSYNIMADTIQEYNERLEKKIEERTEELSLSVAKLEKSNRDLTESMTKIRLLSGLLPMCSSCKKIRNDKGYWEQIEVYIRDHSEAEFSHGICPACSKKLYPEFQNEDG